MKNFDPRGVYFLPEPIPKHRRVFAASISREESGDQLKVLAAVLQFSCETFVVHPGISRIIGRWPVDGKLFQESPIKGDGYLGISLGKPLKLGPYDSAEFRKLIRPLWGHPGRAGKRRCRASSESGGNLAPYYQGLEHVDNFKTFSKGSLDEKLPVESCDQWVCEKQHDSCAGHLPRNAAVACRLSAISGAFWSMESCNRHADSVSTSMPSTPWLEVCWRMISVTAWPNFYAEPDTGLLAPRPQAQAKQGWSWVGYWVETSWGLSTL